MDKNYKRIMRCIAIVDERPKNVDVKNLRVSLNKAKCVKIPKGLTLKEVRNRVGYIGRITTFEGDYSDRKEGE